jgi:transcriptional regulator with XRE-family HTH domain
MAGKILEPVYRQLGAKIQSIRECLGWTQDELAKKVGLTRTSITNFEAGRQRILLHDLDKFAKAFNMDHRTIMKGIWW